MASCKCRFPTLFAVVVLTSVSFLASSAHAELLLVYAVNRHGARNVLPKSVSLVESDSNGGTILLPEGQRSCYEAGVDFRTRYLSECDEEDDLSACLAAPSAAAYGVYGQPGVGFTNYNTLVRSSGLDRSISSAYSFLTGVFPPTEEPSGSAYLPTGAQVLPVYSQEDAQDYLIRAYTRCPAYQSALQEWMHGSTEFGSKEKETAEFRERLGSLAPSLNVTLANWWNVYDSWRVFRDHGVGNPMPDISDDDFDQMEELAFWLESAKMRPSLTGNLLGGPLANDLSERLRAAVNTTRDSSKLQVYYKLLVVSSHYNTQLALLAALGAGAGANDASTANATSSRIPELASVLAFELHADRSPRPSSAPSFYVRAVYQDGPGTEYTNLPLPCAKGGDDAHKFLGEGACTWDAWQDIADEAAIASAADWCLACRNKDLHVCKAAQVCD